MLEERRSKIIEKLKYERTLKVTDLIKEFDVSIETIRRDLEFLEGKGYLKRVYGGAIRVGFFGEEPSYKNREVKNLDAKRAIAAAAAEMIENGDTVFFDIGTTCLQVARCLSGKKDLTIITNSMLIARDVADFPSCHVYFIGGYVRKGEFSTSGALANASMMRFNADKAIIGAAGITLDAGITDYNMEEADIRARMIERAKYSIVVADSSKFGVVAVNTVCALDKVGVIVTDCGIPDDVRAKLSEASIEMICVSL